jgi:hypothetical protein
MPGEDDIENSVDNLLLILRVCKVQGPYKQAQEDYEQDGVESGMYKEYIAEPDYVAYYRQAVGLSVAYIAALYEIYTALAAGADFEEPRKQRFLDIVSAADLSCPLGQNILAKARDSLTQIADGQKYEPLFEGLQ